MLLYVDVIIIITITITITTTIIIIIIINNTTSIPNYRVIMRKTRKLKKLIVELIYERELVDVFIEYLLNIAEKYAT